MRPGRAAALVFEIDVSRRVELSLEAPRPDEIDRMSKLVEEALHAGAMGFSSSRTVVHRSIDGLPVPGSSASREELMGIGRAMVQPASGSGR